MRGPSRQPAGERNDCVPQKVYECLGTGKPVLALLPDGDARDILAQAGTALLCSPRDVGAIKASLLALVEHKWRAQADECFIASFQRRQLTARLAGIMDRTLVGRNPEPQSNAFTTMMPATSSATAGALLPSGHGRNHKAGNDAR